MKAKRDWKNSLDTPFEKGKLEMARSMLIDGETIEKIIKYTGLLRKEIEEL